MTTLMNIASRPLHNAAGKPATNIVQPVKREADVLEMLSYAHSLGIDHVRESEMMWIAEEAYNAPLPPGWTEHQDEDGRTYFYNTELRQSVWQHPMDDVFMDIANYWRRVMEEGHFWKVDNELAEREDMIRAALADWIELYDSSGGKFYFNKATEESCFDDPRHTAYQDLYTRIRFVNMMKQKLPSLASLRRPPEAPIDTEAMLREKKAREAKVTAAVLRVQACVRVMQARRKARALAGKRCLDRVPAETKSRIALKVTTAIPGTKIKQVYIGTSESHKQHNAATKIQSRMRAFLEWRRIKPILEHKRYMAGHAMKIQRVARIWLAGRTDRHDVKRRRDAAILSIQCWARMMAAKRACAKKRAIRAELEYLERMALRVQTCVRRWMAKVKVTRMLIAKYAPSKDSLRRAIKVYEAKAQMILLAQEAEPVQCVFKITQSSAGANLMPYVWRLAMVPLLEDGKIDDIQAAKNRNKHRARAGEPLEDLPCSINLFSKVGEASLENEAAAMIQHMVRGAMKLKRFRRVVAQAKAFCMFVVDAASEDLARRSAVAPIIQKWFRGWSCRRQGLVKKKYQAWLQAKLQERENVSSFVQRFVAQDWLFELCHSCKLRDAATMVQARWRGVQARRHVRALAEESEWPVKGWFEYTGMGLDCVRVQVKFLRNRFFHPYKHFKKYSEEHTLLEDLEDMQREVDDCLFQYLGPEEYAAIEAERAAEAAAKQAAEDSAREARENQDMAVAEEESWVIENKTREAEREARRLVELELMAKEEEDMREYVELVESTQMVADALGEHSGMWDVPDSDEEDNLDMVAEALVAFSGITGTEDEEWRETQAMEKDEALTWVIENVTRAEEAAARELWNCEVMAKEEQMMRDFIEEEKAAEIARLAAEEAARLEEEMRDHPSRRSSFRDVDVFAPGPAPKDTPEQPADQGYPRGKPRIEIRPGLVHMPTLKKLEQNMTDQLERRLKIADKRRSMYPIPSQVEMMTSPQRVIHRHVHHHVHHHATENGLTLDATVLPHSRRLSSAGRETLEPLKIPSKESSKRPSKSSSKASSKRSTGMERSKSDSRIKLKPLQQPGAGIGPALRYSLDQSLDGGNSGFLPQQSMQRRESMDSTETPRRSSLVS
eukprot:TRINITY_DN4224_c2_g4_i1.p1 TRINITY_DN4224_c2_g4~~TRINITY_DN4224_c2_g4_i1.p1  ORF type:complete len:1123 (-),score=268.71 TRINITY_DN4224_c2_g4_i1:286-3654(-)